MNETPCLLPMGIAFVVGYAVCALSIMLACAWNRPSDKSLIERNRQLEIDNETLSIELEKIETLRLQAEQPRGQRLTHDAA